MLDCVRFEDLIKNGVDFSKPQVPDFYEISFFFSGKGEVIIDGERLRFQAGTVLLFPPAKPRQWLFPVTMTTLSISFVNSFMESFMKDNLFLYRLHYFGNADKPPSISLSREKVTLFRKLVEQIKDEIHYFHDDSQHLLRSYLYQLLILLNREYAGQYNLTSNLYTNTAALRLKRLVGTHIREKQTVNEYASMMGVDRNRLNKLCKEVFGKEAGEFIKNELLKACKSELLLGNKTITEISYQFNFSAPSNFVRFFKSYTGYSPADYRLEFAK
ncbi:AraC family transcriptional regulator [Chitinophaga sp.]|uniref:AraC family transcriptional regulator n=1 Tax=Chitinophaga sp. TaxID=1869181 RepID=UPI002D7F992C|nr:AraC family transcriptional regulator [Chitinophaga sp.]